MNSLCFWRFKPLKTVKSFGPPSGHPGCWQMLQALAVNAGGGPGDSLGGIVLVSWLCAFYNSYTLIIIIILTINIIIIINYSYYYYYYLYIIYIYYTYIYITGWFHKSQASMFDCDKDIGFDINNHHDKKTSPWQVMIPDWETEVLNHWNGRWLGYPIWVRTYETIIAWNIHVLKLFWCENPGCFVGDAWPHRLFARSTSWKPRGMSDPLAFWVTVEDTGNLESWRFETRIAQQRYAVSYSLW